MSPRSPLMLPFHLQQQRPSSAVCLRIASISEDFYNRMAIVGLKDDRVQENDSDRDCPDIVTFVEAKSRVFRSSPAMTACHPVEFAWSQKVPMTDLLSATGDSPREFDYTSLFLHRAAGKFESGHRLSLQAGARE